MNGKNHERLNYIILTPATFILLYFNLNIKEIGFFAILWIIGTRYITPDLDTNSRPRKRLGLVGWIIDKLFSHRGMLHNPLFWCIVWILGVYFTGWWFTGLIVPQFIHIVTDQISTGVKRVVPKWIRKAL